MTLFLRNRLAFKKKYILKIYDDLSSPSAIVGQACHKAIENYFDVGDEDIAQETGLKHIESISDMQINFGKTGSREQILKDYTTAINTWFSEKPNFGKILAVEKKITAFIKDQNGVEFAIPAKTISDVICENDKGELEIWDHKFVSSYTDGDVDDPAKIIQAIFNYKTVEQEYKRKPKRMVFPECKISKNKNNDPQIQYYIIEYDQHPQYFTLFDQLYNDCTKEIMRPDLVFLPNFQDMFDGDNSFMMYKQGIITADAPVVAHKTKEQSYVDKQYTESRATKIENRDITNEERIRLKLQELGLPVEMQKTHVGPNITMYTMKPSRGIRMSQFDKVKNDIALAMSAQTVRVQAPLPGTKLVGIEIPNKERTFVSYDETPDITGKMMIPIGVDVYGNIIKKDLAEMPHLLIAGTTGSGKSIMVHNVIRSLIAQNTPEQLQLILIDPKRVELSLYRNTPHLMSPVIYDADSAMTTLEWLVEEMESRYDTLDMHSCRDIDQYNSQTIDKMPKIALVIDEFADIILVKKNMTVKNKINQRMVEKAIDDGADKEEIDKLMKERIGDSPEIHIVRLAQKARAVGIHLILATQRPTTDVVTGLLKANLPTRITFRTASAVDSQVVIDEKGAETLSGKGDLLFLDPAQNCLQRLQAFML